MHQQLESRHRRVTEYKKYLALQPVHKIISNVPEMNSLFILCFLSHDQPNLELKQKLV